jgi:benzoyl-CoA reductase subunit D
VLVTGGLALDTGLLHCLVEQVNQGSGKGTAALTVRTHPDAVLAGALGAALLAARRHAQLERLGRLPAA